MRFAVIGDPVDHSLSPTIHRAAYRALELDHDYVALPTTVETFSSVIDSLESGDLAGVNVTMPLKDIAYERCTLRTENADRSRAVNTITFRDGLLTGDNTDVEGVLFAVASLGLPEDIPVTVLGTGGAARAALVAMGDRDLGVVSRSRERARAALIETGTTGTIGSWDDVDEAIIINATPIGMDGGSEMPETVIDAAIGFVDMAYGHGETPAARTVRSAGRPVADGITMLVGQAIRGFEVFTGHTPPIDVMMRAARRGAS